MHRFMMGVIWSTITCMATADEPNKAAIERELETFAGTWEIVSVQPDGATKDARQLVFNKDGTYAAQDRHGKELWAGTFEIHPNVMPKVWDHRSHDAKKEGKDVLGIYDLDGDKLKVACVVGHWKGKEWIGKSRTTGFRLKDADVVIEFNRIKLSK